MAYLPTSFGGLFGMERQEFPYHLLISPVFSLSSGENSNRIPNLQIVKAISWGLFTDFEKTLTIIASYSV